MADFMFEDEVSDSQYGGGGSVQSDFLMSGSGLYELFHDVLFSLCISISIVQAVCVYAQSLSRVCLFEAPQTRAHQAPLSMEFPWQEYWSGLPFPSPGDLPNPGIEPRSPSLTGGFFTVLIQQRIPINSDHNRSDQISRSVVSDSL